MFQETYRIELRQVDVKATNGRHYFWVLKKMLGGGGSQVLGELHGRAADWYTGKPRNFSLSGDRLQFYKRTGEDRYEESLKLPFAKAIEGPKEEVLQRWAEGIRAGALVNKTRTEYDPFSTNSNSVTYSTGRAMGFEAKRIFDPRIDAPNPFVPGITIDLLAGHAGQRSPFLKFRESVGWDAKIEDRFGNEPEPNLFRDDFRDDLPL